jgi:hypothetical protein
MSLLKLIADSTLNFLSKLGGTALSLMKILILWRKPANYPKANHSACIVLGNGPSLANDLEKFKHELQRHDLLCVNGFSISDAYSELKPSYYLMLDPAFWEADAPAILRIMDALIQRTTWELHLYLPHEARKSRNLHKLRANKHIHVHFFNYIIYSGFRSLGYRLFRMGWASPQCQNVLVAAVFHAVNSGHRSVILLGADHSWHENIVVKEDNIVYTKEVHFYDNVEQCTYIPFHTKIGARTTRTMGEISLEWSKIFNGYFVLKQYANFRGCSIYNAGTKSCIDAFPRITREDFTHIVE